MLIDNENKNKKVYEWLSDYTNDGTLDIVTGYFTVGALGFLSQITNQKIKKYRFILGDIVSTEQLQNHAIDLLNENISIEASLKLKNIAIEAVEFLKQSKVEAKTLEPNFCHAKAYIFEDKKDERHNYYVSGSSNLTEAGIGLKYTNNIELNIAGTGLNDPYPDLVDWFNELWNKPQAHYKKTITDENGKTKQVDFKKYLIEQIEKIFVEYNPKELYYKVLFELFGEKLLEEQDDQVFSRDMKKLKNSVIYNTLYDFQQDGVRSLISMLDKYNGAILADAVGLGKTWSALAVMKHYQKSREVILLCPKKLQNNWSQYLQDANSRFEHDELDFKVRFHTDLFEERLEKDHRTIKGYFQSDKDKLIVIDESHNLRNAKSNRYKFLIETLIKQDHNLKVLLLSATPINNSLNDIKNQFSLLVKDNDHGFEDTLDIKSLSYTFRTAQNEFNKWIQNDNKKISHFIQKLSPDFVKLSDSLIVSRTRKMIKGLDFPEKLQPRNEFEAPRNIGEFTTFKELMEKLPPKLTAYKPAYYLEEDKTDVKHNEKQRDKALVKMIYILLYKRFESSWHSFNETILRVNSYHISIYDKALLYKNSKNDFAITQDVNTTSSDEIFEDLVVGKREIKLSEIDANGELDNFISDLKEDLDAMECLIKNLKIFADAIYEENTNNSKDTKLKKLIEIINDKKKSQNKKIIIFTAYTDTANYIYDELDKRGVEKIAVVHGGTKNYETILQKFAPYTKLYKEKQFSGFTELSYEEWKQWIATNDEDIQTLLNDPIDILIATDVLSEGQNLQDADMVVNYDIHWNPVRLIQRMGRIDRIGSTNKTIQGVNFWPTDDIKNYLDLQSIIEDRMATMSIVGTEFDKNLTENLKKMTEDELLEKNQTDKMLKKLDVSWDDIESSDNALGFNDLSLEQFRVDLFEEMQKKNDFYTNMPKGVFTGFVKNENIKTNTELVALLRNRQNKELVLIYIDENGKQLRQNHKEVLEFLATYKEKTRDVADSIDRGEEQSMKKLQTMLYDWVDGLSGTKTKELLASLKIGSKQAIQKVKENQTVEEEFDIDNYDLLVWFVVR